MTNKKYIVNGKEVEYLYINNNNPNKIIVEYAEKFNIITVHISEVFKRLKENNLKINHISRNLKYNFIAILFPNIEDVHGILHALNIPPNCYEIDDSDKKINIINIDITLLEEKYK